MTQDRIQRGWTDDANQLKVFRDWITADGSSGWGSAVFQFQGPIYTAIPSNIKGIYLIVHEQNIAPLKSNENDIYRCVLYAGQGSIADRYQAHVQGNTAPLLLKTLLAYNKIKNSRFIFFWREYDNQLDRDKFEGILTDTFGPPGNERNPPRCRLLNPVPAG